MGFRLCLKTFISRVSPTRAMFATIRALFSSSSQKGQMACPISISTNLARGGSVVFQPRIWQCRWHRQGYPHRGQPIRTPVLRGSQSFSLSPLTRYFRAHVPRWASGLRRTGGQMTPACGKQHQRTDMFRQPPQGFADTFLIKGTGPAGVQTRCVRSEHHIGRRNRCVLHRIENAPRSPYWDIERT